MTFTIENLGPIPSASVELGELTIICGKNNVGKTYLTYTLATFLMTIKQNLTLPIPDPVIDELLNNGEIRVELTQFADQYIDAVQKIMPIFRDNLPRFLAMHPDRFSLSTVCVDITRDEVIAKLALARNSTNTTTIRITANSEIEIRRQWDSTEAVFSLINKSSAIPSRRLVSNAMSFIMARMFDDVPLNPIFPDVFAVTCERTGAMLFRNELANVRFQNYIRENRVERQSQRNRFFSEYQRPIVDELNYILDLPKVNKQKSLISTSNPEIIALLDEISGGKYSINTEKNEIAFTPTNMAGLTLSLPESSSTVRSLAVLNFFLRHSAKPGELLIFDEPELNLHPDNQRKLARLLVMLVRAGLKVFITTHSDYILREVNALVRLNKIIDSRRADIQNKYCISSSCLINQNKVKVYLLSRDGVEPVIFDPIYKAFAVPSFDNTIDEYNNLYNEIRYLD